MNPTDRPSFLRTRARYFAMAVVAAAVTYPVLSCKKAAESPQSGYPKTRESPILVGDGSIKLDHDGGGLILPTDAHVLVITKTSKARTLTWEDPSNPGAQKADLGTDWTLSSNATPDFKFLHTDYGNGEAYELYCPTDWTVTPGVKTRFECKPGGNTKLTPVTLTLNNNGCPQKTNNCIFGGRGKSDLTLGY